MFEHFLVHALKLTWCVIGISPKSRVAFVGPHSPLAQSGNGTITVCNSSQQIYELRKYIPIFEFDTAVDKPS